MKFLPLLIASIGFGAAAWSTRQDTQVVIFTGDADGNLAPCGCTKPQTGGIKRRITAARELSIPGHTTLLDNGNFVAGTGRQDQIKAQTMAEILGTAGWDAINVGPADAQLGLGMLLSLNSLANGKFVASNLTPSPTSEIQQFVATPPFLVIGVAQQADAVTQPLAQIPVAVDDAIKRGLEQAKAAQLAPVLLLQGDHSAATDIAKRFPDLALIEYRAVGSPGEQIERVGNTVLVTPGSDGKFLLRLEYRGGQFSNYQSVSLGPQYKDDPTAARQFRNYLTRVRTEKLVEKMPRMATAAYAGSSSCAKCHAPAAHVWKASLHAHALVTLAGRAEDRDPDCLPCHVVNVRSTNGFKSVAETPDLAGVGCESCHGPGSNHSKSPKTVRLPKVTETACLSCHTGNTSPGFSFPAYWKKIKH